MTTVFIDGIEYEPKIDRATRVSIFGMYDCHLFHKLNGKTVDEVIAAWNKHNRSKSEMVKTYGPTMLCSVIVLDANDKELRRVGPFIRWGINPAKWREAVSADPDIIRLLAEGDTN